MEAFEETYGRSIGTMSAHELLMIQNPTNELTDDQIIYSTLKNLFTEEQIQKLEQKVMSNPSPNNEPFKTRLKTMSLDEITSSIFDTSDFDSTDHKEALKHFFKLKDDGAMNKEAYQAKEKIRLKVLFKASKNPNLEANNQLRPEKFKNFLVSAFSKTADKIDPSSRQFIGATVGKEFYDTYLKDIKDALDEKGTKIDFYYSISRSQMMDNRGAFSNKFIDQTLDLIKRSRKEGWGSGIDITGSISEEEKTLKAKQIKNLREILDKLKLALTGNSDSVFRIHAFEGTNKGDFYKEIMYFFERMSLEKPENGLKNPIISIGHVAKLSNEDIAHFISIREEAQKRGIPLKFVFDANLISNKKLQNTEAVQLASRINKLFEAGFEVGLGSDGTGILGKDSAIEAQLNQLLKAGLNYKWYNPLFTASTSKPSCDMDLFKDLVSGFNGAARW